MGRASAIQAGLNNPSDRAFRAVLGPNLQGGAARAVLMLAGFSFLGALIAMLVV